MFYLSATLHAATAEEPIQVGSHTIVNTKGQRPPNNTNEDRHLFGQIGEDSVFAVFDGHGGEQVSDMLANGFMQQLEARLSGETISEAKIQTALQDVFFWFHAQSASFPNAGSTAAVAYYMKTQRKIISAHAGDSRILIFTPKHQSLYETCDHTATSLAEKSRLDAGMGFPCSDSTFQSAIIWNPRGGWRFGFSLAISRSIGDRGIVKSVLSCSNSPSTEGNYEEGLFQIYATPDITVLDITGPVFLLLASDGLFEGIAAQAAEPTQDLDSDGKSPQPSAKDLDQNRIEKEQAINDHVRRLVLAQYAQQNQNMPEIAKTLAEMAPRNASNNWCGTQDDVSVILARIIP